MFPCFVIFFSHRCFWKNFNDCVYKNPDSNNIKNISTPTITMVKYSLTKLISNENDYEIDKLLEVKSSEERR